MPHVPDPGGPVRIASDAVRKASKEAAARNVWPMAHQVAMGACLYGESLREDIALWAKKLRVMGGCESVVAIVDLFLLTDDSALLGKLPEARVGLAMDADDDLRCMVYALAFSVRSEWLDTIRTMTGRSHLALAWTHGVGGLPLRVWTRAAQAARVDLGIAEMAARASYEAFDILEVELALGVATTGHFSGMLDRLTQEALHHGVELPRFPVEDKSNEGASGEGLAGSEERAGSDAHDTVGDRTSFAAPAVPPPGMVVLRDTTKPSSASKDLFKSCERIAGRALPLRAMPDGAVSALAAEWPHAAEVVRRMLGRQRLGTTIRLKPTLLVGRPGSGKTALATAMGRLLGLEPTVYPCGGASDNSFGGTPSRWSSAGLSAPGEAIRRTGIANPLVILDEIEKAGTSRNHGRLEDCLLPMLEEHTARAYLEVGLDTTMDLSAVNFVATSNALPLSAPLLDRFDVVEMPDPGPEHVGALVRRILEDIARERDEEGFLPPLAPDEVEVVAATWRGGSLRRLRRAVEILLETREALEARQ
ncbi:AAA family ATPase [Antarcticirhabdus aurantiaca]|uniref:AAA family ATPase n=2 Tax=Antarcticirhabdus aurantiaca TaxID=2606717 RepID=A0ACD4NNV3_9HYPH|nr:AAA family ATPase [Jeongeuplla avenae]